MDDMTTPEPSEARQVVEGAGAVSGAEPGSAPESGAAEASVPAQVPAPASSPTPAPALTPASASGPTPAPAPLWSEPVPVAAPGFPDPAQFPQQAGPQVGPAPWGTPGLVPPPPPAKVRKPIGTGRILVGLGALVSIAVGGGIGALIVHGKTTHNQQVTAQALASVSAKPQPQLAGVRSDGSHYGPLFAYLLPIPSGYALGPDDADYGNNSYLDKSQLNGDVDGLLSGVPQSDMSSARGSLADVNIKDIAVRTYTEASTSLVVEILLAQSDVSDATDTTKQLQSTISDANIFRQGPAVPGYGQVTCVLPPGLGSDTIDSMICLASSGDIEVRVNAYGTAPLDTAAITQLVAQQLDRLKTNQTIG